jgi:hypothetical protein
MPRTRSSPAHLPKLAYIALAPFAGADEAIELVEDLKARRPQDDPGVGG